MCFCFVIREALLSDAILPRDAFQSAVSAVVEMSVRPSVRLSVTHRVVI